MCGLKKALFYLSLILLIFCFGAFQSDRIRLGTNTTFNASYMDEGDLYSEDGKAYFGSGLNVRAERYGIGYQMRENNPSKTLSYNIDATFTAATGIIAKAGETFVTDGVEVEDFLIVTNANDASYIGSTGEIIKVDETEITVSMAAAGDNVPDDLTDLDFIVYNQPVAVFLDNGDIHFSVGVGDTAQFNVHSDECNNQYVLNLVSQANRDATRALSITQNAGGNPAVTGQRITYNSGALAAGETGGAITSIINESGATSSDATTLIAGFAAITTDVNDATKSAFVALPGFTYALVVQGAQSIDPDYGYEVTGTTVVDRVNSGGAGDDAFLEASATDVVIFDSDDDYILVGSDAVFEIIAVLLSVSSSKDCGLDFYYSKAGGNWAALSILSDTTSGMQQSGEIVFNDPGDWTKDDEAETNGDITDAYYIKIQRTRGGAIPTLPTENYLKTFASYTTGMYIRGDGTIKPVSLPDASASNDSIYYSTDQSVLVYKDSSGSVNDLY